MIETKEIAIPKTTNLNCEYIEKELQNFEINPLRWAIVDVTNDHYILSVSFETQF